MSKKSQKIVGGLQLLLSSAIYGAYGLLYRGISDLGLFSSLYVRAFFISLILVFILLSQKNKWKKYEKKDFKWFALWILPSSVQPVFSLLAFTHLPVGLAYFLLYAAVTLSAFASGFIFYKEKLTLSKVISLLCVILGIALIYGNGLALVTNIYALFALLAGVLIGSWNTLTKKLSGKYSEEQMIFSDNFVAIIVYLAFAIFSREHLPSLGNYIPWVNSFLFAIAAIVTGTLIIKGFSKLEAQVGSLITPTEIVFGALFGYLFLGEVLSYQTYIGGFLILLACMVPYIPDLFSNKKNI